MLPTLRQILRSALVLALPLALAACGSAEKKGKDQRTAAGEILPGSISDAMLPYDTVRSQPPLAPKTVASGSAGKGAESSDAGPGDPPLDPATAEQPASPAEASAAPTE
jgi:hypothetical protein